MKKTIFVIFSVTCLFFSTSFALAGGRHHTGSYKQYHFPRHHTSYSSHHHYARHFWTSLGIGLLTGIIVNAAINQQRYERPVVYTPYTPSPPTYYEPISTYPSPAPPVQPARELVLRQVATTVSLLNIRYLPGKESQVVDQVKENTVLDVLGAAPGWLYVKTREGQYGWVMDQFVVPFGTPAG